MAASHQPDKKIDTSYRERRRINRLLDFLTRERLTRNQLERIGLRLQKSASMALPPLVRRLWRENDHERLYRYTCLLDFFDSGSWLDQLITLTIKRRNHPAELRSPLLELLREHGVDTSLPPLATDGAVTNTADFVTECLSDRFWGAIRFMDSFLNADQQLRSRLISRLGAETDMVGEAAFFLQMLAYFEFQEVALQAVQTLGLLRHRSSLAALGSLGPLTVEQLEPVIERSIRRLNFLGINSPEPLPAELSPPAKLLSAQSTPPDCYGLRTVWLSWELQDGAFAGIAMQLSDDEGIRHAAASRFRDLTEHDQYLEEINLDEGLYSISYDYVLILLKDALLHSIDKNYYLPPDFYGSRYLFGTADLRPAQYSPAFPSSLLDSLLDKLPSLLSDLDLLLDEPFFEGWIFSDPVVYDLAERLGDLRLPECGKEEWQPLMERFCRELLEENRQLLLRRLMLLADFMHRMGCRAKLVQKVLALGLSLTGNSLPLHQHQFVVRLGIESIEMARQSLAEGYDPRNEQYEDEGEWE